MKGFTTDEPGFVGFNVRAKASFSDAKVHLAAHFMTIKRQTGFSAQRITRTQDRRLSSRAVRQSLQIASHNAAAFRG